ncbi:MAG: hypothetical protein BroJett011_74840 [Chloroflexota bacterium]|nr:MAG: hypothetical protein BroJett011_74840 [Chloroflexota bacterium]
MSKLLAILMVSRVVGISAAILFDPPGINEFGDCAGPNIVVRQIQDGDFVPVYTLPQ